MSPSPIIMHDDPTYSPPTQSSGKMYNGKYNNNPSSMNNNNNNSSSSSNRSGTSANDRSGRSRSRRDPQLSASAQQPASIPEQSHDESSRIMDSGNNNNKPSAAKSSAAPVMAAVRREQRRRPTNYTSSYTPPANLVSHAARARKAQSPSRRKCSSLDRSEDDGDEKRRHLSTTKSGSGSGGGGGGGSSAAAASALAGVRHHQAMLQQHQAQFASPSPSNNNISSSKQQAQKQGQMQRHSYHEQHILQQQQQQQSSGENGRMQQRHSTHEQQQHAAQLNEMYHSRQKLERRDRHATPSSSGGGGGSSNGGRQPQQQHNQGGGGSHRSGTSYSSRSNKTANAANHQSNQTNLARGRMSSQEAPDVGPSTVASAGASARTKQSNGNNSFYSQGSNATQFSQSRSVNSGQAVAASPRHPQKQKKASASPGSGSRPQVMHQGKSGHSSPRQSSKSRSASSRHRSQNSDSSSNNNNKKQSAELSEQQRIEEYAGKRALLRLEQELADHSESHASGAGDSNSETVRNVMDRRKLARVPQVKKSDLIIGEYLGRGNFCDVFEVTWTLPEQRDIWTSNRTLSTYDDYSEDGSREGGGSRTSLEASMESLSCSNDLSLIRNEGVSRRSISQIRTTSSRGSLNSGGGGGGGGANTTSRGRRNTDQLRNSLRNSNTSSLCRNPNVLALKCLRPAVRAQPRKFVIGAEDLAHETALLACLDHPNIIQLYGRAEGCFSTAFQMRSKTSGNTSGDSARQENRGKQMSNEGYFIILDKLNATLTGRIDEWKDECRAINGVIPPDGSPVQLPPEATLREHLCKRLKVAYCIADAIEYLHSRHVVFRDLKPANVGFDCNDCVKMFDFGFATSIAPLLSQPYDGYGPLTETCGTRRYMAPEVALKLGYGKEVDVYSFGMLLWEICALDKPFDTIQSVDEFHDLVVLCGRRPSLNIDPLWTVSLKNLMCKCWSTDPLDRPTMAQVKSLLCNVLRDMNKAMNAAGSGSNGTSGGNGNGGGRGSQQQRQEQGGNFIHKWRRRVSI